MVVRHARFGAHRLWHMLRLRDEDLHGVFGEDKSKYLGEEHILSSSGNNQYLICNSCSGVSLGCLGIAGKCNKVLEHKKGAYFL